MISGELARNTSVRRPAPPPPFQGRGIMQEGGLRTNENASVCRRIHAQGKACTELALSQPRAGAAKAARVESSYIHPASNRARVRARKLSVKSILAAGKPMAPSMYKASDQT